MTTRFIGLLTSTALSLLVAGAVGCGAGSDDSQISGGDPSGPGSGGAGTGQGGAGAAGETGGAGGDGGAFNPVGSGGMGQGGMETCLATEAEADKKPLDMIIVWDRSGSMSGAKWTGTQNAVTQFVNDPASEGVSVGLNFFPPLDLANDECAAGTYNPPQVALELLPMGAQTLVDVINMTSPTGLTPTYGGLFGTLQFLTAHKDANPGHAVVAVLASDGSPTSCNTSTAAIAGLAQSAFNYNGVRTYAIAIQGSDLNALNQIAMAGGTDAALDVTSNISLFQQKMEEIRADALGCDYIIPEQPPGEEFDPQKLNIKYTPMGMGSSQTIPNVANEAACGNSPGWYYDDPVNPTQVFLCPASCTTIQGDTEAEINFEFGCPTVIP
ncbi:MAG: vWA domain-containing protein [Polyangiaceae bacterium]